MLNENQIRVFKELFITNSEFKFIDLHRYFDGPLVDIFKTIRAFKDFSKSDIIIGDGIVYINVKTESEKAILSRELNEYFKLVKKSYSDHIKNLVLLVLFLNFFLLSSIISPRYPFSSSSPSISSLGPVYSLLLTFYGILILLLFENKDLTAYLILLVVLIIDISLSFSAYSQVYHGYFVDLAIHEVYEFFIMLLVIVAIIKRPKVKFYS